MTTRTVEAAGERGKTQLGLKILARKSEAGLTWAQVAERLGHSPVWSCAACLGQMSMEPETAKAGSSFELTDEADR